MSIILTRESGILQKIRYPVELPAADSNFQANFKVNVEGFFSFCQGQNMRFWVLPLFLTLLGGALSYAPLQYERIRGFHHKQRYFGNEEDFQEAEKLARVQKEEQEYLRVAASPRYRLNDTFIPSKYTLELLVLLDNDSQFGEQFTAPGKVAVEFQPTSNQSMLRLHANLLRVIGSSMKITNKNNPNQVFTISNVNNDTDSGRHFLEMNVSPPLLINVIYEFYAEFVAPISRDRQNGLYLSVYTDPATGEERRHTATQMESYHLRQLLPCFDEPHLKASFDVTIIRKDNYTTLGNEAITSLGPDPARPGYSIDTFSVPLKMTPYLFALVVSDFTFVEAEPQHYPGKTFRVYAPPYMISRGGGQYAANQSAIILKQLDDLFDFPYPLSKMDSVAIPVFAAGAMENYALNLYRPSLLINYPGETLESERYLITNVLTHELAHQHFGNLVTCKWWSVLWLNEGFATWINYFGMDSVTPEFRASEDILNDAFQYSMPVDVSANTHPLRNDLALSPEEIDDMFSALTYERGGSINRMMEGFLTKETFIKGLQYYLKDMQERSAEQDDLWWNLQRAVTEDSRLPSGLTVKGIMDTWTRQSGHPLVRVSAATSNSIFISQERYGLSPDEGLWYVPITVVSQDSPTRVNFVPDLWLEEFDLIKSHRVDTTKWVMVNQDATGYFRVLYDEPLRTKIQGQLELEASVISPLSRSQLLDDYFTLASHGLTSIESALELTKYLAQEDHFTVWDVVSRHMRKPYNLFGSNATIVEALKNYLLPRVAAALLKVGVEQDATHVGANAMYRAQVLDWACVFDHTACSDYTASLYQEWTTDPTVNPVPVDIQATIFCAMVKANVANAEFILARYREARADATVRTRLRNSLACSSLSAGLQNAIDAVVMNATSGLAASDRTPLLQRIAANPVGRPVLMNFLETRLSEVISTVGGGSAAPVASIVSSLSGYLATQDELTQLETFITTNADQLSGVNASLQASLGIVRGNIQYANDVGLPMLAWLQTTLRLP